jgi:NAD(P)-dependent dehydrogenase (short-subunit alcohol dehydrogenase family)
MQALTGISDMGGAAARTGGAKISLHGEAALVTAATRGIGRECVLALAEAGASLAIGCRDLEAGNELAAMLCAKGVKAMAVAMNMQSPASIAQAVAEAEAELGLVTVLVNNAGHSLPAAALDVAPEAYDSMFELNVKAAFFTAQAVARRLTAERRAGAIVNIASQAGMVALRDESVYCMTKAAMMHMTRCLAVEWAPAGIRVNAVAPTFVSTDGTRKWLDDPQFLDSVISRIPLGRVGITTEIAWPVVFLASGAASLVTGTTLAVDGGWTAV